MFSGKSTELVRRVRRFAVAGKKAFTLSYKASYCEIAVPLKSTTSPSLPLKERTTAG